MKARDLIKTEGIIKVSPDATVSSAVSGLQSSHDAAFVFNDQGKYLGVINPYYNLIKDTSHTGAELVRNCLYHPPKVDPDDSVEKVVGLMMDVRLHYLPVVSSKGKFEGIISARRILNQMHNDPVFSITVLEGLKTRSKPLVSVYEEEEVSKVVNLFEREDVSKLVVIDKDMKLKGIMSYYDLVPHLIAPVEIEEKNRPKIDDHDPYAHLKVKNVAQKLVHTRKPESTLAECLEDIIKREIGSVVIVNREGYPSGIVTVRDLLRQLKREEETFFIELTTNDISDASMQTIQDYGVHLNTWVKKLKNLRSARLVVREEKNGSLFKVALHLLYDKGGPVVYQEEGKNLLEILQKINKNN